ncbi:MAG: hypothetical protein FJ411_03475 [Verrucomicrobia bacterium]|nr:hypothetical protein [Verrucomicrobiota bacterium]
MITARTANSSGKPWKLTRQVSDYWQSLTGFCPDRETPNAARMTGYARGVKNGSAMCGIAQMGPQLKKSAQQFFLGQYLSFQGGDF